MIAKQTDIRNFQFIHDVSLPQEFIGDSEVAEVSGVNNEVNIIPLIEVINKV